MYDNMVFQAGLHGIDLDAEVKKKGKAATDTSTFQFRSPEEYDHLPMEERKKLTQEMLGAHKLKFS